MSRRHYVYYRVAEADSAAVASAVRGCQRALCAESPGLQAELLCRPETADGLKTFMEVYGGLDIDAERAARIEQRLTAALHGWLHGPRHVETFDVIG